MDELSKLIAEQAEDLRRGAYQSRESEVVLSFDDRVGEELTVADFLTSEGSLYRVPSRLSRKASGCAIHGYAFLKTTPSGSVWCRPCNAEWMRQRRLKAGVKPRNFCPHGGKYLKVTPGGREYCTECKRLYNQRPEVKERRRAYDRKRGNARGTGRR